MSDDELRKQAMRERTRFTKLRHLEDQPVRTTEIIRPFPWSIVIILIVGALILARSLMKPSLPAPRSVATTVAVPPPPVEPDPNERERATDASVKEMLLKVNGEPSGPRPVSAPSGSGGVYYYSGPEVEMPEMVKIKGRWVRKRDDNIYNVQGEVIYQHDKRKDRE